MRQICEKCHYPSSTCICSFVKVISTKHKIHVLQHYKETKHAKNTVRLARLAIQDIELSVIKTNDDVTQIYQQLRNKKICVLYPSKCSRVLNKERLAFKNANYDEIIFIDGTWKQTKGIFNRLAQQCHIEPWELDNAELPHYYIRKSPIKEGMSTLEAIASVLETVEELDVSTLYSLLKGFQSHWQGPQKNPA
ncbi:DTW domain-containing protein [Alteromonas sp. 5E99-2]|uniref:DTW domain-containing protein n=1 Tax=Alteromonas sp. 5E99-2 TaxID=2817683 RepID=UPI001A9894B1|nr:tRNA-uridine aminocarboxypropyltransferase [Alteromonas sp. 5E99-2]MBO1256768.1 DTW domain-containing protein [Alteromonas sp. 5E99-2]